MSSQPTRDQLCRIVLQQLQGLRRAGVEQLRRAVPDAAGRLRTEVTAGGDDCRVTDPGSVSDSTLPAEAETNLRLPAGSTLEETEHAMPEEKSSDRKSRLLTVQTEVAACELCSELAETRTQTVFGVGNPDARLCFLGEAPGADEDAQGEPFVGRAGQLLTKMIEAMTLTRDDVYILNILKCRPPGNRNPSDGEAANCRGFLDRQFEIIQPQYICCLGAIAAKNLLRTNVSVGKLRGRLHDYGHSKVVVTYHPAYLLRNPSAKKAAWEDLKILMSELELSER